MHIGKTYKFTETVKKGFSHSKFFNFLQEFLAVHNNQYMNKS